MDKYRIIALIVIIPVVLLFASLIFAEEGMDKHMVRTEVPIGKQYHYISDIVVPGGIVNWSGTQHYNILSLEVTGNITSPVYYDKDNPSFFIDPSNSATSINVSGDIKTTGSIYAGDLKFKNGFYFTEVGDKLALKNPKGETVLLIDEDGNIWIKGEVRKLN